MQNDYEFEKGQRVIWTRDNGARVYGYIVDRDKEGVRVQLRDNDVPENVPRGLFSRLELA